MSKIGIRSYWVWRKSEDEPELRIAWDHYAAIEANPEGWEAACKAEREQFGDEFYAGREIDMYVDFDIVLGAFSPPETDVEAEAVALRQEDAS